MARSLQRAIALDGPTYPEWRARTCTNHPGYAPPPLAEPVEGVKDVPCFDGILLVL